MIPAEAVEAAARVLKDSLEAGYVEGEDLTDLLIDVQGFDLLAAMKVALEAAAPHMLAACQARIDRVEELCAEEDARQTAKAYVTVEAIRTALEPTP